MRDIARHEMQANDGRLFKAEVRQQITRLSNLGIRGSHAVIAGHCKISNEERVLWIQWGVPQMGLADLSKSPGAWSPRAYKIICLGWLIFASGRKVSRGSAFSMSPHTVQGCAESMGLHLCNVSSLFIIFGVMVGFGFRIITHVIDHWVILVGV